jgi:preprotein translocase subunit SecE
VNRETKRLLQREDQVGPDEEPVDESRPAATRSPSSKASKGPRSTPLGILREVRNELRKVVWPSRLEVRNYSVVVLFTLIVMMALILALDYLFSEAAVFLFK